MGRGKTVEFSPLFGAEMDEDPYPVYRRLRESHPVYWDESLRAWVPTRYDDVAWSLKGLSSDRVSLARARFQGAGVDALWDILAVLMAQRDEPDHGRLRALVQKAFYRASVEQWANSIERRIRSLLAPALQRGHMDFIWDFAVPLSVLVISELVGIPEHDRERVKLHELFRRCSYPRRCRRRNRLDPVRDADGGRHRVSGDVSYQPSSPRLAGKQPRRRYVTTRACP